MKKLVSSNFMGMVSSVSFIFYTGDTYSCSSNKGDFLKLEDNILQRNLTGIAKGLIYGFGIVEFSIKGESGRMIALRAQAYYVTVLPNDLFIIPPQGICTSEGYKGTFLAHFNDEHGGYAELNLRRTSHVGRRPNLLRGFTSSRTQRTTLQIINLFSLTR